MRTYGALSPINQVPVPADIYQTAAISSAGAVAAFDWPAGVQLAGFIGQMNYFVNWASTKANLPSTNCSGTTLSSDANDMNPTLRQVNTGMSTGYSVTGDSSGIIVAALWRK